MKMEGEGRVIHRCIHNSRKKGKEREREREREGGRKQKQNFGAKTFSSPTCQPLGDPLGSSWEAGLLTGGGVGGGKKDCEGASERGGKLREKLRKDPESPKMMKKWG